MFFLINLLLIQLPLNYGLLAIENSRTDDASVLIEALEAPNLDVQRQAVRALGRMERTEYKSLLEPMARSQDASVRIEAVNSLGQMGVSIDFLSQLLLEERDPAVLAVIYRTMGRLPGITEELLVAGLEEVDPIIRAGSAAGIGTLFRSYASSEVPSLEALSKLRLVVQQDNDLTLRKLSMTALNVVNDMDHKTINAALSAKDPQLRRLAVIASGAWREDSSHIVRYEALRLDPTCDRARNALFDASEHVSLLAIEKLGELDCPATLIASLADRGATWRHRSKALIALAKVDPIAARERLHRFMADGRWQVRAYAARAGKLIGASEVLDTLVRDKHPNVVSKALRNAEDAIAALASNDYGLIMDATSLMGDALELNPGSVLLDTLLRITAEGRATSRDPRIAILQRLKEFGDPSMAGKLQPLLADLDPLVAARTAEILSEWTGRVVSASNSRYEPVPLPGESFVMALGGATALVRMQKDGEFTLQLMLEEAPATVAIFAMLADAGFYNGLTFHRIVPNFVIQGGSAGANEYVGDGPFMTDEVGLTSHLRGTVGVSTRGRDTGDGQIFINLADNFRLDHNYTVFARVIDGMEIVDRIQEGSIIDSIEIIRWTFE